MVWIIIAIVYVVVRLVAEHIKLSKPPFHNDPAGAARWNAMQDAINNEARRNGVSEEFIKSISKKY